MFYPPFVPCKKGQRRSLTFLSDPCVQPSLFVVCCHVHKCSKLCCLAPRIQFYPPIWGSFFLDPSNLHPPLQSIVVANPLTWPLQKEETFLFQVPHSWKPSPTTTLAYFHHFVTLVTKQKDILGYRVNPFNHGLFQEDSVEMTTLNNRSRKMNNLGLQWAHTRFAMKAWWKKNANHK